MDEIMTKDWEECRQKLIMDLCSMYVELEYFKRRKGQNVKLRNSAEVNADQLVQGLEVAIPNIREKIEIINNLMGL